MMAIKISVTFDRLKAAWAALKDPSLVGEATGMRKTLLTLDRGCQFALLSSGEHKGYLYPKVSMISYRDQESIRHHLGYYP